MNVRAVTRAVLAAAVGLLCVGMLAGPASAANQPPLSNAEKQIDSFLTQYGSALKGSGDPQKVRSAFLAPELNQSLDSWARQNHADPVFRDGQNVPQSWDTSYQGSGMGLTHVTVIEHFASGTTVDVQYSVRLDNQQIVGLS